MKTLIKKVGLPPGSLIFTGKQHADKVRIDIIDYDPDNLSELKTENIEDCFTYKDSPTNTWIDIKGVHDADQISKDFTLFA